MTGCLIDTFRNITTAANQEFVRKSRVETSTRDSLNRKADMPITSLEVTSFC